MRLRHVQLQLNVGHENLGGGLRMTSSLAQGLRSRGITVSLLRLGAPHAERDRFYDRVITCQPRPLPLLWRLGPWATLPSWLRIARAAAADADAIISLSPVPAVATKWAYPHKPLIYAPAVVDAIEWPAARSPYRWFERRAFRIADRVLVTSPAVRDAIATQVCPLRRPVGVALLGVDQQHAAAGARTRAELGIPADAKLLLTVGGLNENKGQALIAAALAKHAGPDWWWAVLGRGPAEAEIRAQLGNSPFAARTRLVGEDPAIGDWYRAADCLVGCSRSETFGMAIAEALSHGVPVVIPQTDPERVMSPLAPHIDDFQLGATFMRGDAAGLCKAIQMTLADSSSAPTLRERCQRFATANFAAFNWATCALELFDATEDVTLHPTLPAAVPPPAPGVAENAFAATVADAPAGITCTTPA